MRKKQQNEQCKRKKQYSSSCIPAEENLTEFSEFSFSLKEQFNCVHKQEPRDDMHQVLASGLLHPLEADQSHCGQLTITGQCKIQSLQTLGCAQLCWHSSAQGGKLVTALGSDEEFLSHLRNLFFPFLPTMEKFLLMNVAKLIQY